VPHDRCTPPPPGTAQSIQDLSVASGFCLSLLNASPHIAASFLLARVAMIPGTVRRRLIAGGAMEQHLGKLVDQILMALRLAPAITQQIGDISRTSIELGPLVP
jgi:hypothetical protein